ncbi:hypothetical protein EV183_004281 [Coemansia sp. RSA 2336]|nr:hypothetical protein EV183_004281 [Coemansia sp. RSA 2336]
MSQNNELSAEAVEQAIGAKASVQEAQAQQFQALMAGAADNRDPAALSSDKERYKHLVGKKYVTPKEHKEMKAQGKDTVDEAKEFTQDHLPKLHRVIEENGAMTMDYRPDRLNVFLDKHNKCTSISWV